MKNPIRAFLMAICLLSSPLSYGSTIRVPADQPTIQAGINAAQDGDVVLVAPDTYVENISFGGKAIRLVSEGGADITIIHGNWAGPVVTFNNYETVESIIDGFMLIHGHANKGGGIYIHDAYPTIKNCVIVGNTAEWEGGGIYDYNYASPPRITNCIIAMNTAYIDGGGIYSNSSTTIIQNCSILGNFATNDGGGIYFNYMPEITNSLIAGNIAYGAGGGIYADTPPKGTQIKNCTITANTGEGFYLMTFGGSLVTLTNSILWNNSTEIYAFYPDDLEVTYSDVKGGWIGTGNINADPLFDGSGDYYLTPGSPCIDTGHPSTSNNDQCFPPSMGTARNDMGAYGGPKACCWNNHDEDGDGYDSEQCGGRDCNDNNPNINPGAKEIPFNGIDENCDGTACFIATVAFGSDLEGKIAVLRSFRDQILLKNSIGTFLVSLYDRCSPQLAHYIAKHPWMKSCVRVALRPLIGLASLFVSDSPEISWNRPSTEISTPFNAYVRFSMKDRDGVWHGRRTSKCPKCDEKTEAGLYNRSNQGL